MCRLLIAALLLFLTVPAFAEDKDKWEGYLEFMGKPGTARHLGQSDLFVPFWQDKNDLSFFNLRGSTENFDDGAFNIGIGHRHMFDKYILGAYGYFDSDNKTGRNYQQASAGLEFLSVNWDIRANGYISDQDSSETSNMVEENSEIFFEKTIMKEDIFVEYDNITTTTKERSLSGFDGEIGYKLPLSSYSRLLADTRVYLGGYHFIGNGYDSVSGPRVRLEARVYDVPLLTQGSRIMLGIESQYDDVRGTQTAGLVSLRIPLEIGSKNRGPVLSNLERRMVEPVIKDIDIITSKKTDIVRNHGVTGALNPEDLSYTKVMRFDTDKDMDTIIALVEAETANGELPLVIIETLDGTKQFIVTETPIPGQSTLAMAGVSLEVGYFDAFDNGVKKISFTPEGDTPEQLYGSGEVALNLSPRAHINGWDIDATNNTYGLEIKQDGNYWVTNTNVKNAKKTGIYIWNENKLYQNGDDYEPSPTVLYLYDTRDNPTMEISGNLEWGIRAGKSINGWEEHYGGTLFASNLLVERNGWKYKGHGYDPRTDPDYVPKAGSILSGIQANSQWGRVEISDSTISWNRGHGLDASAGGVIYADNLQILYNDHDGVDSNYYESGLSYINIKNSWIHGNYWGLITNEGGIIEADNVIVSENRLAGVLADGDMTITNSFILNNAKNGISASLGAYSIGATTILDNVVISGNGGYGVWNEGVEVYIFNSVIEDNEGSNFFNVNTDGTITVDGCVISEVGEFEICED